MLRARADRQKTGVSSDRCLGRAASLCYCLLKHQIGTNPVIRAVQTFAASLLLVFAVFAPASAQSFGALARALPEQSGIEQTETSLELRLAISQPIPFRVFTLVDPFRVVVDFREVTFDGLADALPTTGAISQINAGTAREPGWSRLVLGLEAPLAPVMASMQTNAQNGTAVVALSLEPVSEAVFVANAGAPASGSDLPEVVTSAVPNRGDDRLMVVIDPGHGGVDPGAVRGVHTEADLVLTFAREMRDVLRRTGLVDVVLTRDGDLFVPLPTRVTLARAADADLFISVHADALAEGRAQGATIYTLSETATDAAAAALAEQHDRADILQGIDLHGADDVVAGVLMDLARLETGPRGEALADEMVGAIREAGLNLHSRPRGRAGFTVLRAADIPSVLVEIGFMSDERDLERILDADWRAEMQEALLSAILNWAEQDAARTALLRQ